MSFLPGARGWFMAGDYHRRTSSGLALDLFQKPTFFLYIWEVDREVNQPFIDYCSTAIINMPYFDGFYHKKMVNLGMV